MQIQSVISHIGKFATQNPRAFPAVAIVYRIMVGGKQTLFRRPPRQLSTQNFHILVTVVSIAVIPAENTSGRGKYGDVFECDPAGFTHIDGGNIRRMTSQCNPVSDLHIRQFRHSGNQIKAHLSPA